MQDFLIGGSAVLAQLEVLTGELEHVPDDATLLDAVFRGFRAIRSGAAQLGIVNVVAVSHKAEDIFALLRNDVLIADQQLMGVTREAVAVLRTMFSALSEGHELEPAPDELVARLIAHAEAAAVPFDKLEIGELLDVTDGAGFDVAWDDDPARPAWRAPAQDDPMRRIIDEMLTATSSAIPTYDFDAYADSASEDPASVMLARTLEGQSMTPGADVTRLARSRPADLMPSDMTPDTPARATCAACVDHRAQPRSEALDAIDDLVSELAGISARLAGQRGVGRDAKLGAIAQSLEGVSNGLLEATMKARTQPLSTLFERLPEVVSGLAASHNKVVALKLNCAEVALDNRLLEALAEPLLELVRNAFAHGFERPAERVDANKAATAVLEVTAALYGTQLVVAVTDDGRGIDADALRSQAVALGLLDCADAAGLDIDECHRLMFRPGLSTHDAHRPASGRGFGMAMVKAALSESGGTVELQSAARSGTTIRLRIPLSVALLWVLVVEIDEQLFAFPKTEVEDVVRFERAAAHEIRGRKILLWRGRAISLIYPAQWLAARDPHVQEPTGEVLITRIGAEHLALLVDNVRGEEEVALQPMGILLQDIHGVAGTAVTRDGRLAFIVNPAELIELCKR